MNTEVLHQKLYEKMAAEQKAYRDWLLTLPPDVILDHACGYSIREDILMEMEGLELSKAQVKALLRSLSPLGDIHRAWDKTETHHMDDVRDVIEARANAVIQAKKEKGQREER